MPSHIKRWLLDELSGQLGDLHVVTVIYRALCAQQRVNGLLTLVILSRVMRSLYLSETFFVLPR